MFTSSGDPLVGGEVLVAISQKLCKLQDQQHQKLELNEDGMSIKYANCFKLKPISTWRYQTEWIKILVPQEPTKCQMIDLVLFQQISQFVMLNKLSIKPLKLYLKSVALFIKLFIRARERKIKFQI